MELSGSSCLAWASRPNHNIAMPNPTYASDRSFVLRSASNPYCPRLRLHLVHMHVYCSPRIFASFLGLIPEASKQYHKIHSRLYSNEWPRLRKHHSAASADESTWPRISTLPSDTRFSARRLSLRRTDITRQPDSDLIHPREECA